MPDNTLGENDNEYEKMIQYIEENGNADQKDLLTEIKRSFTHTPGNTDNVFNMVKTIYGNVKNPLSDYQSYALKHTKEQLTPIIEEYFAVKDKVLQFKKVCGVLGKKNCSNTALQRIKAFVAKVKNALGKTKIPDDFRLQTVDDRVTPESIVSVTSVLNTVDDKDDKDDDDVKALILMCNPAEQKEAANNNMVDKARAEALFYTALKQLNIDQNLNNARNLWRKAAMMYANAYGTGGNPSDKLKAASDFLFGEGTKLTATGNRQAKYVMTLSSELEKEAHQKNPDDSTAVTNGGRRSRYRRRPTKKYFKTRRHSSHKKKRHTKRNMKTKRHMKRHRKTKRH
jgi:hypothetical protein